MKLYSLLAAALLGSSSFLQAQTFVSTTAANRNVILEEFTGINCGYCPDGHSTANSIASANPGRFWAINIHSFGTNSGQPNYETTVGDAITAYYAPTGYPNGVVNRAGASVGRGSWSGNVTTQLSQASPVNVAARCTINLNTRQMTMTVETYYTGNGTGSADRLNAFILQNNVEGPQLGASGNPSAILPNGNYNHMHMFRHSLTGNWGTTLTGTTQGTFHSTPFTYTIPASYTNIPASLGDLEVIVFITDSITNVQTAAKAQIHFLTSVALGADNFNATASGTFCTASADPTLRLRNMGSSSISSVAGTYTVNGGAAVPFTHTLTTPVPTASIATIPVTGVNMPNAGANTVVFTITELNGTAVSGIAPANLTLNRAAEIDSPVDSVQFVLTFDNYPEETSWRYINETTGATVQQGGTYNTAPDRSSLTFMLPMVDGNCYRLEVLDNVGDGLCYGGVCGSIAVTHNGTSLFSSNGQFTASIATKFKYMDSSAPVSVAEVEGAASNLRLYPNPTRDQLNLEFELAQDSDLNIVLINALGQEVEKVSNGNTAAGFHNLQVSTANLASGTYFVRFQNGNKVSTQRFVVLR